MVETGHPVVVDSLGLLVVDKLLICVVEMVTVVGIKTLSHAATGPLIHPVVERTQCPATDLLRPPAVGTHLHVMLDLLEHSSAVLLVDAAALDILRFVTRAWYRSRLFSIRLFNVLSTYSCCHFSAR